MQLEVGKKYIDRDDTEVLIVAELPQSHRDYEDGLRFIGMTQSGEFETYTPEGKYYGLGTREADEDLICEAPVPRYRPFVNAAEFAPHRDRWIKRLNGEGCWRITSYCDDVVRSGASGSGISFEDLCEKWLFDDGTPCGVKIN